MSYDLGDNEARAKEIANAEKCLDDIDFADRFGVPVRLLEDQYELIRKKYAEHIPLELRVFAAKLEVRVINDDYTTENSELIEALYLAADLIESLLV